MAVILALTGSLKIWSSFGQAPVLYEKDPLISVANGQLYFWIGLIEIIIAGYVIEGKDQRIKCVLFLWLAACFSAYRIGTYLADISGPCACLGARFETWPWLEQHLSTVALSAYIAVLVLTTLYLIGVGASIQALGLGKDRPADARTEIS